MGPKVRVGSTRIPAYECCIITLNVHWSSSGIANYILGITNFLTKSIIEIKGYSCQGVGRNLYFDGMSIAERGPGD